ncbi:Glutathione S-transferase P 10-like protein [Cladobotryum mycophilum]|uniref:Glutathione S-transferase P 10-like protein n=1 Tax=Cladobotryum mycophilum TaxID=491253 RepID=A0ABR0SU19_9HYPO
MAATTPVLHYFSLGRLGRGEVVRLFLRDAGVDFKDILYTYDATWANESEPLQEKDITRTGKLPALEYKGHILNQHIPILRYLAQDLGSYDGATPIEKYVVDAVADIYIDWRAAWVPNISGPSDEFKNKTVPKYYDTLAKYYAERNGPYLLGDRVTYADFAIYQSIDNNERIGSLPATLPDEIVKFRKAFEARPNIAAYIKENLVKKA